MTPIANAIRYPRKWPFMMLSSLALADGYREPEAGAVEQEQDENRDEDDPDEAVVRLHITGAQAAPAHTGRASTGRERRLSSAEQDLRVYPSHCRLPACADGRQGRRLELLRERPGVARSFETDAVYVVREHLEL
jgi:hypothetical protein